MTTTIAVQPLEEQEGATGDVIQLDIFLRDVDTTFDRLEVWRSRSGESGPYEELTAVNPGFPRIPESALDQPLTPVVGPSAILDTLTLELLSGDDEVIITFAGADPITFGDAATQVNAQGLGLVSAYVDAEGAFVLEGSIVGTLGRLEVTGGDAAPNLGLVIGALAFGHDARLSLIPGQSRYLFKDLRGNKEYFYRTRTRNASNGSVGEFSRAFSVASKFGLARENVIVGTVDLIRLDGRPLVGREVRLHTSFNGTVIDGKVMTGGDVLTLTDEDGHAEFRLVRGQKVTVAIPGTNLFREITVPTDPAVESFGLLDPDVSGPDVFKVAIPDLVVAERRSLS